MSNKVKMMKIMYYSLCAINIMSAIINSWTHNVYVVILNLFALVLCIITATIMEASEDVDH